MSVLEAVNVNAYYGNFHALKNVSLSLDDGEIAIVIGQNGVGKTTLLKAIMGMVETDAEEIRYGGMDIGGYAPHETSRAGIAFIPGERRLFQEMSVFDNLKLGYIGNDVAASLDDQLSMVYEYFPPLEERRNQQTSSLSGGEQQMLAIGRALMSDPGLLLLDEPTEGLMPSFVDMMREIILAMKDDGLPILLVEHELDFAFEVSDYTYIIDEGTIGAEGPSEEIRNDESIKNRYLTI